MAKQKVSRKLTAIFAADMVGYSRLMEADEEGIIARQKKHRDEVIDPKVSEHQGRIVKLMGDGMLVEFASVVDAVRCAVEVQQAMLEREADVPEDRRIRYRVGINLGDIVIEGDDILGDGVNVATRLEGLAAPGGITISDVVHQSVIGKLQLTFEDMGEQEVKNIQKPIRAFQVRLDHEGSTTVAQSTKETPALDQLNKPSIAVLAFNNMSADPEHEFFADGIAEEIITALSKVSAMRVIARNSTFAYKGQSLDLRRVADELGVRYVLEGSVRSGGDRIRVTAQLIDASDGSPLWADRYDRVLDDIFDIQDQITKEIVTALRVQLTDGEEALIWARGTNSVAAWQLCVPATELFLRFHPADYLEARALAEKSIKLDPNYAHAYAVLGFTYWWEGRLGYKGNSEEKFQRAFELSERALELDSTVSWAIGLRAMVLCSRGNYDEAIAYAKRGVASHPGSAYCRAYLGFAFVLAGQFDEAIEHIEAAMALNPHHPTWYLGGLARALMGLGRVEEALEMSNRIIDKDRHYLQAFLLKAMSLVRLGRPTEAKEAAREFMQVAPDFRTHYLRQLLVAPDQETVAPIAAALQQAGIPE